MTTTGGLVDLGDPALNKGLQAVRQNYSLTIETGGEFAFRLNRGCGRVQSG